MAPSRPTSHSLPSPAAAEPNPAAASNKSFFSRLILLDAFSVGIKDSTAMSALSSSSQTATTCVLEENSSKMVVNLGAGSAYSATSSGGGAVKREHEKEKVSSDSNSSGNERSASRFGSGNVGGSGRTPNNSGSSTGSATSSKLSKFGKRLRDSCRNLRGKSASASKYTPEDYTSINAPKDSNRSRHYVAMDFSGKVGRIVDGKDIRGYSSKEGYTYFRRKVTPKDYEHLLTETQSTIHLAHPWFHKGLGRDMAQRILATHNVDGAFLVRDSSVSGGYVISYVFNGRTFHAQVLPETNPDLGHVYYSLDDGKTKFFDLLQVVEFYQLNRGSLHTKLTHLIVREETPSGPVKSAAGATGTTAAPKQPSEKPQDRDGATQESESSNVRTERAPSAGHEEELSGSPVSPGSEINSGSEEDGEEGDHSAKMDTNHNSHEEHNKASAATVAAAASASNMEISKSACAASSDGGAGGVHVDDDDAAMASEGDSDSLREHLQG